MPTQKFRHLPENKGELLISYQPFPARFRDYRTRLTLPCLSRRLQDAHVSVGGRFRLSLAKGEGRVRVAFQIHGMSDTPHLSPLPSREGRGGLMRSRRLREAPPMFE